MSAPCRWKRALWASAALLLVLPAVGRALAAEPVASPGSADPAGAERARAPRLRELPGGIPSSPSIAPTVSIPVGPLGFTQPGALYLGERNSLVSLDFVDESRLLFTFRVPGLLRRSSQPDQRGGGERQIRAVVLDLPSGTIETEAIWTLHDRARYLWMLRDGHFLLRDGDGVKEGDASLELKPLLHFPGPVLWLEMDPAQRYLVSNSTEPGSVPAREGDVGSPETAQASMTEDGPQAPEPEDIVVRILRRESGQVMLVSRVRSVLHLPINADGYVENLRGRGIGWVLNLSYFSGGSRILGQVESTCLPTEDFIAENRILVSTCGLSGERRLGAMTTDGELLWQDQNPAAAVWPVTARSADGSRLVDETLMATHAISAMSPLDRGDIKGQVVRVLDAATGEPVLTSAASPALDAGGNVALSPSGRRAAILNDGALQIFDLPASASPSPAAGQGPH
jgi:hypothetical protein